MWRSVMWWPIGTLAVLADLFTFGRFDFFGQVEERHNKKAREK